MPEDIAPNRSWRVAVVGAGYFSQFHLQGWRDAPGADVVALCDSDQVRAAQLASRYGIEKVFTDCDAMLDAVSPDLVDIATPPASHAGLVALARKRRLPAICQKPFGRDYWDAAGIARESAEAGVPLMVHENFRFMPWFREAKRLLDNGTLGRPFGISFRLRPGDGQGPRAYLDRQPYFQTMPRLLIAETAVHFIDTFRYLLGEVVALSARLRRLNPAIAGEDAGFIHFEFGGDVQGLFDGNRLTEHSAVNMRRTMGEMWLEGSAGVLRLDGDARLWLMPHGQPEVEHPYDGGSPSEFGGGACGRLQEHVIRCLERSQAPDNTAQAYLENLRIQEAVYQSHHAGRRIEMTGYEPARDLPIPNFR